MTWNREELAWAAGLFEGEGCFTRTNAVPMARLASTDMDVLANFARVIGFGTIYPRTDPNPDHKVAAEWVTTTFEQVQALAAALWPWLHERRRARAAEVLLAYQRRRQAMARGDGTLAGELFGKRATDLTPAEYTEYRRVQGARLRRARGVPERHFRTTDPNRPQG